MSERTVIIIGIGNLLLTDDGFGIHVVHEINKLQEIGQFPKDISIIDGGAAGIDILSYIENQGIVIFVDSIKGGNEPGHIYRLKVEDLNIFSNVKVTSLHDLELSTVLKIAKNMGILPREIYLIGVEPVDYTTIKMELSPQIKKLIPEVIKIINIIVQKAIQRQF